MSPKCQDASFLRLDLTACDLEAGTELGICHQGGQMKAIELGGGHRLYFCKSCCQIHIIQGGIHKKISMGVAMAPACPLLAPSLPGRFPYEQKRGQ